MSEFCLNIDPAFPPVELQLRALEIFREKMEEFIAFHDAQEHVRLDARLRTLANDADEANAHIQMTDWVTDEVVPQVSRGAYLVTLWAALENGVQQLADYVRTTKSLPIKLSDIRGRTPRDRWQKYFEKLASFRLGISDDVWELLDELRIVRNNLAHSNGQVTSISAEDRGKLDKRCAAKRGLSYDNRALEFSEEYVRSSLAAASSALSGLSERVKALRSRDRSGAVK